jgi:hypothetical protein
MPHQLDYKNDREGGGLTILLVNRKEPLEVGHIRQTPNGRWHGEIKLDGRIVSRTRDTQQALANLFDEYAAHGIPDQSELQEQGLKESRAWIANIKGRSAN